MVKIFVNIQGRVNIDVEGKAISGLITSAELGIQAAEEDGTISLVEPFNHTSVQMDSDGLIAINIIVSEHRVHVLGNYSVDKLSDICCVTLSGTTVCARSAAIRSGHTTIRC